MAHDDCTRRLSRRSFLSWTAGAITAGLATSCGKDDTTNLFPSKADGGGPSLGSGGSPDEGGPPEAGTADANDGSDGSDGATSDSAVAIVRCTSYDAQALHDALAQSFDLLGGIDSLVKGKIVTIKPNLTGDPLTDWPSGAFGHTAGETYIIHGATALALTSLLLRAGAQKVRIVESPLSTLDFVDVLDAAGWDGAVLQALGNVELESTRNLGNGTKYAELAVPGGGLIYQSFLVNHSYAETDVFISLAKMKEHDITGVTLSMKNLFGILPNAVYGADAATMGEDATGWRGVMHDRSNDPTLPLPGEKPGFDTKTAKYRMPHIITDLVAARRVHLAIIEAVTTERGGEGPWEDPIRYTTPGLFIVGRNPVSTDAVAVATMGYRDPLAPGGTPPFVVPDVPFSNSGVTAPCDNHILLAHQAGLGTGDLSKIDVRGLLLAQAIQYAAG